MPLTLVPLIGSLSGPTTSIATDLPGWASRSSDIDSALRVANDLSDHGMCAGVSNSGRVWKKCYLAS